MHTYTYKYVVSVYGPVARLSRDYRINLHTFGKGEQEAFSFCCHGNAKARPSSLSSAQLPGTCCVHTYKHTIRVTQAV